MKIYNRNKVFFARYRKKGNKKIYIKREIAPFTGRKIMIDEKGCIEFHNLFDKNLFGILDESHNNISRYQEVRPMHDVDGNYIGNRLVNSIDSNINISKYFTVSEVILMAKEIESCPFNRVRLLSKRFLTIKDIVDLYDFITEHPEIYGLESNKKEFIDGDAVDRGTIKISC